jgi:hypothetical protein
MADAEQMKTAMSHALLVLRNNAAPNTTDVRNAATLVVGLMNGMGVRIEIDDLVKHIAASINVHVGEATVLDNKGDDHQAWLPARRGSIKWSFWSRYRWYLENERGIPAEVIERMNEVTDMILERLEDPQRPSPWDRRGMVVGDVQSGKTSNYSGLICKAADAGYSAIIILAGMHNNLRSQTQERIDTGLLGFDTEKNLSYENADKRVGVGLLKQTEFQNLPIFALTSSKAQGDFRRTVAESLGVPVLGGTPVVFVVKKNKSVLENLCQWLNDRAGDAAALIIDDEADNASINTGVLSEPGEDAMERDPTTINRLIRTLLLKFKKRAYVGYTATPFANIFIHSEAEHSTCGPDLFPSAFILNLHTPSNHVGPAEVFGLPEDRRIGQEEREGLPVVRTVDRDEAQGFMPFGHKKDYKPLGLPASMKKAVRSFLLSCAMRGCRGQENEHQSMLVHVTRFIDVQGELRGLIRAEVQALASTLKMEGKGNAALMKELKELWDKDYVPTSAAVTAEWDDPLMTPVTWDCVKKRLAAIASRIQVETMNGEAGDVRYYKEAKNGCYIIAIGGDKLSRGLTLEGLTVSYFLRPSHMYDTLMQMGRWFGYRPGYMDACRLFITAELQDWYQYIAGAMLELRKDFDYMTLMIGATPQDFGLRVRQHPAELEITSANKMRSGTQMQVSFADTLVESVFFLKKGPNSQNLQAAKALFGRLGKPTAPQKKKHYYAWYDVDGKEVVAFLKAYQPAKDAHNSRGSRTDLITEYIDAQMKAGELEEWTVVLVNNKDNQKDPAKSHDFGGGLVVGLRERNNAIQDTASPHYRIIKDHWISPEDEWLDLDDGQLDTALKHTVALWEKSTKKDKSKRPDKPTGKGARNARSAKKGLLLVCAIAPDLDGKKAGDPIYTSFAVSFPASVSGQAVTYTVNNVYSDEYGGINEPDA